MKKPETPKTHASTDPAETKSGSSETISIDSKGNANVAKEPADQKPGTTSGGSEGAKPSSTSNATSKSDSQKSGSKTADAKPEIKPGMSQKTASDKQATDKTDKTVQKKRGGRAILLFVIIIAGALVTGWLTRTLWWRDAEPVLSQYVPAEILAEITPAEVADNQSSGTGSEPTTDSATPSTSANDAPGTSSSITPGAPERDDAMIGNEDNLSEPTDNAFARNEKAPSEGDETVVVDTALTERLSRLEGTINALRERLDSERGDSLNSTVARRMAEIETRTAPIEELARVEAEISGVEAEMRDLSARLSTMEEEVRATAGLRVESRGQAIAMAVTILRDAVQRGGSFMIALNQLERSGSDDPVIAEQISALKPLADRGAPTIEKLRQSFPAMAQKAVQASSDDHSGSVLDATWANIKKLIPVRRIDVVGEESLDGRLVTAETALESDDLDGAIAALDGIEGDNARAAVNEWLEDAKSRQVLNGAIATLSAHAINLLTGDGSANTGDSQ